MPPRRPADRARVYSTELGRLCADCGAPAAACTCRRHDTTIVGDGRVRVSREVQGRAGKGVTVIRGLPVTRRALDDVARQLKKRCGSGGTVKDDAIEIQGDHRDTIVAMLAAMGYDVKRAGG